MNKDIKKLFISLALYSMAGGLFYNFLQLWMATNYFSTKTISIILSLCSLLTVSTIFIFTNIIKKNKLKKFVHYLMILKIFILLSLFILNNTGLSFFIKLLLLIDYSVDVEIFASFYPMISLIEKSDEHYAKRGLIYDGMYYVGVLLTSILLGKSIGNFIISYNSYIFISAIFMLLSYIVLKKINLNKYVKDNNNDKNIFFDLIRLVKKDKISSSYLLYLLSNQISYYCINGMMLTMLTLNFGYNPKFASTLILILGIVAVIVGYIILKKLTLRNDYINIFLKYGIRIILYILVVIFNNNTLILCTIIFVILLSDSYTHITEAPYINRYSSDYQLSFSNLREMVNYLGRSIGTYFCGIAFVINIKYNFLFALLFIIISTIFAYYALYLRGRENDRK